MIDDSSFIGLIIFSALVSLTPGPNNLMLAASAANFGFFRTVPHICGVVFGFTFMVLATGFGLGGLINPKGLSFLVSIMTVHISAGPAILPHVLPFAIMLPSLTILSAVS